jgi:hypothetical protein
VERGAGGGVICPFAEVDIDMRLHRNGGVRWGGVDAITVAIWRSRACTDWVAPSRQQSIAAKTQIATGLCVARLRRALA